MNKSTFTLSASLLSANFAELGKETQAVLQAGADWVHLDIMDNHYVPNLTFGPMVCKALRDYGVTATLDVHLMVRPVDQLIQEFAKAGATYITIHPEATDHLDRSLQLIHDSGCKAGIALNPATPLESLTYVMEKLDLIMLMSVNPGFSNQKFIPYVLEKVQATRRLIDQHGKRQHLSIDGGVKLDNIQQIAAAGADTFVMGSAIFDTKDYAATIQQLRAKLA